MAGVTSMAMTMPMYWASAESPAAMPRSLRGNHLTETAVTALRMKGCATAKPTCATTTAMKLWAKNPLTSPDAPMSTAPIEMPARIPYVSITYEAGKLMTMNTSM